MRTTLNIDEHLLAEAKVIAARQHRTIGSVVEEALRRMLEEPADIEPRAPFALPKFQYEGGLMPGVDLYDKEQMAELLGDNEARSR